MRSWSRCRTPSCAVVRAAVRWLRGRWATIVAGRVSPLDAWVLLAGDHTVWDPGGGDAGAELCTHLRLCFCRALQSGTCAAAELPMARCALLLSAVLALTASWTRWAIRLNWLRVTTECKLWLCRVFWLQHAAVLVVTCC